MTATATISVANSDSDDKLVVRNTFLELLDERGLVEPRRRAYSSLFLDESWTESCTDKCKELEDRFSKNTGTGSTKYSEAKLCGLVSGEEVIRRLVSGLSAGGEKNAEDPLLRLSESSTLAGFDQTTLMLRNIPNVYTLDSLLELLDQQGFQGRYNFVYLPIDFRTCVNLGYAFVNCVSDAYATDLMESLHGFSNWVCETQKVCNVSWAHPHQGLEEHIERYRNSPVMHESVPDAFKPWLFVEGQRIGLPPPTKKIRPPRIRQGKRATTFKLHV